MKPEFVVVGRVIRPHGVRGALRVAPETDFPERLLTLRSALLVLGGRVLPVELDDVRSMGRQLLVRVRGVESFEAAAAWRGSALAVPREAAAILPPGQQYVFDVLGLVVETEAGDVLGRVEEVLRTGSNDVYVVRGEGREVFIPAISSVVLRLDVEAGRIVVRPLPGMLDEDQ